ncbi:DUF1003 domain-containing protein [Plastoroseomonas arctica]|uniref:DUF1003 domain-containing protein n=1 Tax=Plastoroseomonas arctica TaxID=1509237 RepID=A0AAF1JZC7_9PROT|nr:DUF1003 domain-containing protein [Plastoroseomonas arctica]MBR0654168.1 DUF1003 domain-containing protein [Plastoroseomonas arctica]
MAPATTTTTTAAPDLGSALTRNIKVLEQRRRDAAAREKPEQRVAQAVTRFTGSMRFVYLHLALFGCWIAINVGLVPGVPRFDASLVILAMVASVEAIFLSTFVLISQNRMENEASARAELDLQISLLTEHELTHVAKLLAAIAERLGVPEAQHPEVQEIQSAVAPEAVIDAIAAEQAQLRD